MSCFDLICESLFFKIKRITVHSTFWIVFLKTRNVESLGLILYFWPYFKKYFVIIVNFMKIEFNLMDILLAFCFCDNIPEKINLMGWRFILAHGIRDFSIWSLCPFSFYCHEAEYQGGRVWQGKAAYVIKARKKSRDREKGTWDKICYSPFRAKLLVTYFFHYISLSSVSINSQ